MQKPRRTSEFSEFRDEFHIDGTAIKRQNRQRQTVAPSPQQGISGKIYKTRQSRLRPPSLDRERSLLSVPQSTAKSTVGTSRYTTPLRNTPISTKKTTTKRALFSADRTGGGPPHNDKKWVQDRAQCITEYLKEMVTTGSIASVGQDFFTRGHGLRQMSIKQFVGIINFFLQFVWRNRFVVGTNHVDDIINILHRLDYPHTVNKSWLMTPNTQLSFGHVIVLLDFLKDFAPPSPAELSAATQQAEFGQLYEFELLNDDHSASISQNHSHAPKQSIFSMPVDAAFRAQLIINAADAFEFWDNKLTKEYNNVQKITSDMIIKKRSNLADYTVLVAAVAEMEQKRDKYSDLLSLLAHKDEDHGKKLIEQQHQLQLDIQKNSADLQEFQSKSDAYQQQLKHNRCELQKLTESTTQMQHSVKQQKYNAKQRAELLEEYAQGSLHLQMYKRTHRELLERNLNQQVMLSRAKNELTEKLEKLNTHMRDIQYSVAPAFQANSQAIVGGLALPTMQPLLSDIEKLSNSLKCQRDEILNINRKQHKRRLELAKEMGDIEANIKTHIQSELTVLETQLSSEQKLLDKYESQVKQRHNIWVQLMKQIKSQLQSTCIEIEEKQDANNLKRKELADKVQANEQKISKVESEHARLIAVKEKNLDDYEAALDKLEMDLQKAKSQK